MADFVKISDSISSDSSVVAASSKAVKTVADNILTLEENVLAELALKAPILDESGKNIVRSVNGVNADATGNASTCYEPGDTITGTFWGCATITGSTKKIVTQIPLDRPINATNATISATTVNVRQNGTYLIQSQDVTSYVTDMYLWPNGVEVNFWNESGWGGTNNDAVSIAIIYTITFS